MKGEKYYNKEESNSFQDNRDSWYFNTDLPGSKEHWNMCLSLFDDKKSYRRNWFYQNDIEKGPKKIPSRNYII